MTDTGTKSTPADYGYTDTYRYLHICSTCFELYETGRPNGEEQQCRCRPRGERWPGVDFNERAILCRCCALNVLPSGSRWAPYFCRECQLLAMGVSVWAKQLIFPIGRHSLMHTWVPETPSASLRAHGDRIDGLADGVHAALTSVTRGSDGLTLWYETIMPRNLERFGLRGGVSLLEYMNAVAAGAPALMNRLDAFDGLCRLFQSGPTAGHGERRRN